MKPACWLIALLILGCSGCRSTSPGQSQSQVVSSPAMNVAGEPKEDAALPGIGETPDVVLSAQPITASDPIEPVNRAFFYFNDKLYFWVLKPVSRGYNYVLPQVVRRDVKNFFSNIATPIRLGNCALQAEFTSAWIELERFGINTTVGVAGFGDPAKNRWNLEKQNGDFGQTLGRYGLGPSIYINWPIIGPLCARDSAGYVGDLFLDPFTYLVPEFWYNVDIKAYDTVNATSLSLGEYEDFKKDAIDPYIAFRDAYYQYRRHLVETSEASLGVRPVGPLPEK